MLCTVHTAPRPGAGNRNGDHWVPYPFHHRVLYWALGFYYTLCCYRSRSLCCVHYSPFPSPFPSPVPCSVYKPLLVRGERVTVMPPNLKQRAVAFAFYVATGLLGPVYPEHQHQRCDDPSNIVLIENNGVTPKWVSTLWIQRRGRGGVFGMGCLSVQFLSFYCSFRLNSCEIIGFFLKPRGCHLPLLLGGAMSDALMSY